MFHLQAWLLLICSPFSLSNDVLHRAMNATLCRYKCLLMGLTNTLEGHENHESQITCVDRLRCSDGHFISSSSHDGLPKNGTNNIKQPRFRVNHKTTGVQVHPDWEAMPKLEMGCPKLGYDLHTYGVLALSLTWLFEILWCLFFGETPPKSMIYLFTKLDTCPCEVGLTIDLDRLGIPKTHHFSSENVHVGMNSGIPNCTNPGTNTQMSTRVVFVHWGRHSPGFQPHNSTSYWHQEQKGRSQQSVPTKLAKSGFAQFCRSIWSSQHFNELRVIFLAPAELWSKIYILKFV